MRIQQWSIQVSTRGDTSSSGLRPDMTAGAEGTAMKSLSMAAYHKKCP